MGLGCTLGGLCRSGPRVTSSEVSHTPAGPRVSPSEVSHAPGTKWTSDPFVTTLSLPPLRGHVPPAGLRGTRPQTTPTRDRRWARPRSDPSRPTSQCPGPYRKGPCTGPVVWGVLNRDWERHV